MRCLILLTLLVLAMLAVSARAGKVTIKGACVDCNRPGTTTTTTPKPSHSRGRQTTAKPKSKSSKGSAASHNDDDDSLGDFSLSQDSHGSQHIHSGGRHKRQRQVILSNGVGGWPGQVTTIDSRGYPGTVVRNDDCVGCNIRG